MTRFVSRALAAVRRHSVDVFDLAGLASVVYGVSMIYVPAAFIVAGVAVCAVIWIKNEPSKGDEQ